jgi:hypothetical protein
MADGDAQAFVSEGKRGKGAIGRRTHGLPMLAIVGRTQDPAVLAGADQLGAGALDIEQDDPIRPDPGFGCNGRLRMLNRSGR